MSSPRTRVSTRRPTFFSSTRSLPADHDLEELTRAIRQAARHRGLSSRTCKLFETWILGFLSWCLRTPPYEVGLHRIEPFRRALSSHPETGGTELAQAMDALSFFFGAVEKADDLRSDTATSTRTKRGDTAQIDPSYVYYNQPCSSQWASPSLGTAGPSTSHSPPVGDAIPPETHPLPTDASPEPPTYRPVNPSFSSPQERSSDEYESKDTSPPDTLYNPSPDEATDTAQNSSEEQVSLQLTLSSTQARRLQMVANHLGLSPSLLAARAIELVCDEVTTVDAEQSSNDHIIDQYQAQIDLLHAPDSAPPESDADRTPAEKENDFTDDPWAAVDEIIESAVSSDD